MWGGLRVKKATCRRGLAHPYPRALPRRVRQPIGCVTTLASTPSQKSPVETRPDATARIQARDEVREPRAPIAAELPAPEGGVSTPAQAAIASEDGVPKNLVRRHPIRVLLGAILLAAIAGGGYLYWDHAGHFETTDDAFIEARQFAIAPKIAGYITAISVTDNQHVGTGDIVAQIDDRDYRIALEQAKAQVATAQAAIQNIDAQTAVQQAQISASHAQVEQAQAAVVYAQQQEARYRDLAARAVGSVEMAQQTAAALLQSQAALKNARAVTIVAQRQLDTLKAQRGGAEATLDQTIAQRDQAQLNLVYTAVTAAQPGRVANLTAAVGQFAQAGTSLTMFVPDELWVTANYKETQLDRMRPGQAVTLRIDAYPRDLIRGHVASVQPGSGTAFSLLPAENATGNFVKVVQRVPVKIIMENRPASVAIGPGMSAVPSVRVNPAASLYERLMGQL
jgi:membrane fusion protein (multidrug efflux system)